jgi:8-oxo-dGTP pyrophosphatase MutT (NUDIX family)
VLLTPEEALAMDVHGGKDAAVLVPLFEDGGLHAVFTRRRHDLRRHAGEISFPGGRRDERRSGCPRTPCTWSARCRRPRRS